MSDRVKFEDRARVQSARRSKEHKSLTQRNHAPLNQFKVGRSFNRASFIEGAMWAFDSLKGEK